MTDIVVHVSSVCNTVSRVQLLNLRRCARASCVCTFQSACALVNSYNGQLNNLGTNIMKLAINNRQSLPPDERPRVSAMPVWLGGFSMFTLGTAMSFGAFKFAAQSLLSSLSSVQFLSQVFFSRVILDEKIEKYAYAGVALIIAGCTLIVIFGAHDTKNYKPEELAALYGRSEYVCYMLGCGFLACVVSLSYSMMKQRIMRARGIGRFDIAKATVRERQVLAVLFSIKSALFGSQAVVLAKSLSMLLIQALHPNPLYSNPLLSYQTYFIILGFIAAATYWVTRLNHGLRLFEAVYLIPMMQICWILFSTVAGGIYYEEFIGFGQKEYSAYAVGFVCVLVGVAMLCPRDDAKSLNAADVIYDIVSDENPAFSAQTNARFEAYGEGDGRQVDTRTYQVVPNDEYEKIEKPHAVRRVTEHSRKEAVHRKPAKRTARLVDVTDREPFIDAELGDALSESDGDAR